MEFWGRRGDWLIAIAFLVTLGMVNAELLEVKVLLFGLGRFDLLCEIIEQLKHGLILCRLPADMV
jgi:hypothetical protein